MKAIMCKTFSSVSDLSWEEAPDPVAGPKEIVIDVKAAGLNYPDNLIVRGLYQFKPNLPFSPGHEGSCLLYTSPSPRDGLLSRMPSSA